MDHGRSTRLLGSFADEGLAAGLDLLAGGGIDHVVVVGADLLVQALGRRRTNAGIACWTKLEITPPSISNLSRYGTKTCLPDW